MPNEDVSRTNRIVSRETKVSSKIPGSNTFQPGDGSRAKVPSKVTPSNTPQPVSSGGSGSQTQGQSTGGQQQGTGTKK